MTNLTNIKRAEEAYKELEELKSMKATLEDKELELWTEVLENRLFKYYPEVNIQVPFKDWMDDLGYDIDVRTLKRRVSVYNQLNERNLHMSQFKSKNIATVEKILNQMTEENQDFWVSAMETLDITNLKRLYDEQVHDIKHDNHEHEPVKVGYTFCKKCHIKLYGEEVHGESEQEGLGGGETTV